MKYNLLVLTDHGTEYNLHEGAVLLRHSGVIHQFFFIFDNSDVSSSIYIPKAKVLILLFLKNAKTAF